MPAQVLRAARRLLASCSFVTLKLLLQRFWASLFSYSAGLSQNV